MMISKRFAYGAIVTLLGLSGCMIDRGRDQPYGHDQNIGHGSERQEASDRGDAHCDGPGDSNRNDCHRASH